MQRSLKAYGFMGNTELEKVHTVGVLNTARSQRPILAKMTYKQVKALI